MILLHFDSIFNILRDNKDLLSDLNLSTLRFQNQVQNLHVQKPATNVLSYVDRLIFLRIRWSINDNNIITCISTPSLGIPPPPLLRNHPNIINASSIEGCLTSADQRMGPGKNADSAVASIPAAMHPLSTATKRKPPGS